MAADPRGAAARAGPPRIAVTGATGFIGRRLAQRLAQAGFRVSALARPRPGRALPAASGLGWIEGDLADRAALRALVAGADAVIHLAGATAAPDRAAFHAANAEGTARLTEAARDAGAGRLILVSSLAALRPAVSDYAASKSAGEAAARAARGTMPLTILRAPAVFGPGDAASAPLFRLLARGWLPVPGGRAGGFRFSVADVDDLCRLLEGLAAAAAAPAVIAPCSVRAVGWADLAASAARVTGRPVRRLPLPGLAMTLLGGAADAAAALSCRPQVFSSGKIREIRTGDWIADTLIPGASPLDETMRRCLAPFLPPVAAGWAAAAPEPRSPK